MEAKTHRECSVLKNKINNYHGIKYLWLNQTRFDMRLKSPIRLGKWLN